MERNNKYRYGVVAVLALSFASLALWFILVLAPQHWMRQLHGVTVKVDERPVAADAYIGNPTGNEADAYIFVHAPNFGDYLLNLDDNSYRDVSSHEFIRAFRLAWTRSPMRIGSFKPPLPFLNLNEYRIATNGRIMTVTF